MAEPPSPSVSTATLDAVLASPAVSVDPVSPATPTQSAIALGLLASARPPDDSGSEVATAAAAAQTANVAAVAAVADADTASPGAAEVVIEADSMTISPWQNGSTYSDADASGGSALLLSKRSSATTSVELP
ncbi:MAG: hypothetical protein ACPGVY_02685, partial [Mycobacterium sp.]